MKLFVLLFAVYGTMFGLPQDYNSGCMKDLNEERYSEKKGLNVKFSRERAVATDQWYKCCPNLTFQLPHRTFADLNEERYFENKGLNVIFSPERAVASDQYYDFGPNLAFQLPHSLHSFWQSEELKAGLEYKSLWYKFPEARIVTAYSFRSRNWGEDLITDDGPSVYEFWGSNGDCNSFENRIVLKTDLSGDPFGPNCTVKEVNIDNLITFICYGFMVYDVPGRPSGKKFVTISDVHLYYVQASCANCQTGDCVKKNGCPNDAGCVSESFAVMSCLKNVY